MQLMKKLKRHDTVVVAISVLIALLLCGGLIYLSTPVVASTVAEEYQEKNKESGEQTTEKLSEISDYLTELDKLVCSNKEGIDSIYETTKELTEVNNNNETSLNTEKVSSELKSTVTEKIIGLDKSVVEIHESIDKTNEKITEIEKLIVTGNQDNRKEIAEGFAGIKEELNVIKQQYERIQENNTALSSELRKIVNDGNKQMNTALNDKYSQMINRLEAMNSGMEARNKETIEAFRSDIASLESEIDGKIASVNSNVDANFVSLTGNVDSGFLGVNNNISSKVSELGDNMDSRMDLLGSNMDSRFGSLEENVSNHNDKVDSDISELRTLFEQELGIVSSRLEQVFQSVSKGKAQVASALLTKGIDISPDASFEELSLAIEKLDTTPMPGEVEYIRHFHVDGHGNTVYEEEVGVDRKGGCFNTAHKHKHVDSCYVTVKEYKYWANTNVELKGTAYKVNEEQYYYYHCNFCGLDFTNPNPNHVETTENVGIFNERSVRTEEIRDKKVPICEFSGKTDSYICDCGYKSGQIIEARIKYDGDMSKAEKVNTNDWIIRDDSDNDTDNTGVIGGNSDTGVLYEIGGDEGNTDSGNTGSDDTTAPGDAGDGAGDENDGGGDPQHAQPVYTAIGVVGTIDESSEE